MHPTVKLYTATGLIHKPPVWLHAVTIAGDGANGDCQIYDGIDTSGEEITHLETLSGTTFTLNLMHPVLLRKGLYLVVSASTTHVTLQYAPADKNDPENEVMHVTRKDIDRIVNAISGKT